MIINEFLSKYNWYRYDLTILNWSEQGNYKNQRKPVVAINDKSNKLHHKILQLNENRLTYGNEPDKLFKKKVENGKTYLEWIVIGWTHVVW